MGQTHAIFTAVVLGLGCAALIVTVPTSGTARASEAPPPLAADFARPLASVAAASGTGCKSVATFVSSAEPALRRDGCLGCHGAVGSEAATALDLSDVGKVDALACAHALHDVALDDVAKSAIIQAPTGGRAHAGGKVSDPLPFTKAMLGWVQNER